MRKKIQINLTEPEFKIYISDNVISLGSCFSSEISKYLLKKSVTIVSNPFGTIYNNHSIYTCLKAIYEKKAYEKNDIFFENNKYFSLDHSTEFDSEDINEVLKKINSSIIKLHAFFKSTDVYIITPGTSVVYYYKKSNQIAANCHKLPDQYFERKMLSIEENNNILKKIIAVIKNLNKNAKIIFTLSPIRHTPNDMVENSLSKSILRVSINSVLDNKDVVYYPSYEILNDEIRDFSFYKNDGIHIKKKTVEIIADKFINLFFERQFLKYIDEYNSCKKLLDHKPRNPVSKEYHILLSNVISKLINLYNKRKSQIIEKDIIITLKRIVKYFGIGDETIFFEKLSEGLFKEFIKTYLKVSSNKEVKIDKKNINYENIHYKKLDGLKKNILGLYYHNKGEYKLSSEIMNEKE